MTDRNIFDHLIYTMNVFTAHSLRLARQIINAISVSQWYRFTVVSQNIQRKSKQQEQQQRRALRANIRIQVKGIDMFNTVLTGAAHKP